MGFHFPKTGITVMGKLEEKRKPGRTRQGWQNNVTIDMKEIV
jgi:hypothetical protein